jgi:ubiquitin-activating enzyme E1
LNDSYPRRIRYISPFAFGIDDTSGLGKYERGGIVEQVKVPKTMSYRSFKDSFDFPYTDNSPIPDLTDFSKIGRNEIIHVGVQAVHKYFDENGKLPIQNDIASINSLLHSTSEEFKAGLVEGNRFTASKSIVKRLLYFRRMGIAT